MKKLLVMIFILTQTLAFSAAQNTLLELRSSTNKNSEDIKIIQSNLNALANNFESNRDNYKTLYDGLGNQIQTASTYIQILLFILTIVVAIIVFFVERIVNKKLKEIDKSKESVEKTKDEVNKILADIENLKTNVHETKNYIDGHNEEMLLKIKRDYTLNYLKRIEKIPEDIANLVQILLASDLEKQDFVILKDGLLKIKSKGSNISDMNYFIMLLVQHFPTETIEDMLLREDLILGISNNINGMFDVDIRSFLHSLFVKIEEKGVNFLENKILLAKFFKKLHSSSHNSNNHILNCAKDMIKNSSLDKIQIEEILTDASTDNDYINWVKTKIIS